MKKNKGYFKVKKAFTKDTFEIKVNHGDAITEVFHVNDGGKDFYGTADTIVFNMRFWDTGGGRCSTNEGYMKLVSDRITGFPVCDDEVVFLAELERSDFIEIIRSN